jgi:UDP-N-acetylmuramoylalanine--D-glutamate ligase
MIKIEEKKYMVSPFKNKKILVVGLARSGTGAANLLSLLDANVTVTDSKPEKELKPFIKDLHESIEVVTGGNPEEIFNEADMIVVSPGVPMKISPLVHAKASGIPVVGELELAYRVMRSDFWKGRVAASEYTTPEFIGITGTNGKSTTTTLVDMMLKGSGLKTMLAGNIGNALSGELNRIIAEKEKVKINYIVTEISSFQLESIESFRPNIAAVLNITPDHLDRYESMDDYIEAKARIFENQIRGDVLVLNADDRETMELYRSRFKTESPAQPDVYFFSLKKEVEGMYLNGNDIFCNVSFQKEVKHEPLMNTGQMKIKGIHNIENAMAASLIGLLAGCSLDAVRKTLKAFGGLEHRLEFVHEAGGVQFINDSKGTNIGAVEKSLMSLEKVVLIMGGLDKGGDFSQLGEVVRERVKSLILIGEAKEKIANVLGEAARVYMAEDLNDAVETAISMATPGDSVLLSPGCASFDMFENFEDRGLRFKEAVLRLHRAGQED